MTDAMVKLVRAMFALGMGQLALWGALFFVWREVTHLRRRERALKAKDRIEKLERHDAGRT